MRILIRLGIAGFWFRRFMRYGGCWMDGISFARRTLQKCTIAVPARYRSFGSAADATTIVVPVPVLYGTG